MRQLYAYATLLVLLPLLAPSPAASQGATPRVSAAYLVGGGPGRQISPAMGGNLLVFSSCYAGNCDVWGFNLVTHRTFPISRGDWDEQQPSTDGQRVVWRDSRNTSAKDEDHLLNNFDIYGANLPDLKPYPISRASRMQNRPHVWGNTVVWGDFRDARSDGDQSAGNIYALDIPGGKETAISTARSAQTRPVTNGRYVVWTDYRNEPDPLGANSDIYAYDLTTGQEFPIATAPDTQADPAISGDIVVWADYRNGKGEADIYGYDLAMKREFVVSAAPGSQAQPAIWGNIVVWADWRNEPDKTSGQNADIYGYDLTTRREFPVYVGPGRQNAPAVAGNTVVWEDASKGNSDIDLMAATLSGVTLKAPPAPPPILPGSGSRFFPETKQTVTGLFLDYWQRNGGLAQQGYPISPVITETSDLDGKVYTVQYFERAVFEYHPENAPPHNALLSQLGTFRYKANYPQGQPALPTPAVPEPNAHTFAETGMTVSGRFFEYWEQNGGLAQQGYPISEPFQEKSELDGRVYTVQYFERAVFEMHPENAAPNDVLLSQLGTFRYKAKYGGR